jgi:hypothetical protein
VCVVCMHGVTCVCVCVCVVCMHAYTHLIEHTLRERAAFPDTGLLEVPQYKGHLCVCECVCVCE